jgi:hypothetical protein
MTLTAFYAQQLSAGKVSIIARNVAGNIFGAFLALEDSSEKIEVENQVNADEFAIFSENFCEYEKPLNEEISLELNEVLVPKNAQPNEEFTLRAVFKNTGNTPLFAANSPCAGPVLSLGADQARDRSSLVYIDSNSPNNYWLSANRIKMRTPRVNPGELAIFEFQGKTAITDTILVEYFTPLIEGGFWFEDLKVRMPLRIGNYDWALEEKIDWALRSRDLREFDISAEKNIVISISEQMMYLRVGEEAMHEFPVSTGAYRTPTPFGTTRIKFKQEVRVGSKWPHYVMPKFMWFRDGGYGIHALPSLRNDGGTFWREARDHIQQRVSHGCVRLLPEDADTAFDFAEVGTPVTVQA